MDPSSIQYKIREQANAARAAAMDLLDFENDVKKKESQLLKEKQAGKSVPPPRGTGGVVHLGAQVEPKPSPALAGGHGSTNTAPTTSATFKPAQSTPSTAATPAAPAVSSPYDIAREQGNSHFRAGQYAQAVAAYTAAIETGSGGAVAWTNRAAARLKLREFEAAASDCSKAIQLDSSNAKAWFRRGVAHKEQGKLDLAKTDMTEALRLAPGDKGTVSELDAINKQIAAQKKPEAAKISTPTTTPSTAPIQTASTSTSTKSVPGSFSVLPAAATVTPSVAPVVKPRRKIAIQEVDEDEEPVMIKSTSNPKPAIVELPPASVPAVTKPASRVIIEEVTTTDPVVAAPKAAVTHAITQAVPVPSSSPTSTAAASTAPSRKFVKAAPVIKNAYEFERAFQQVKGNAAALVALLDSLASDSFANLLTTALDSEFLSELITALKQVYIPQQQCCSAAKVLMALTSVKRFGMAVMFLSADDKQQIRTALTNSMSETNSTFDRAKIAEIAAAYKIEL